MLSMETMIIPSLMSCVTSALVLLTAFVFPEVVIYNFIMRILILISFAEFFGNIGIAIGFVPPDTALCGFQGFVQLYFPPVEWSYNTFLALILKELIVRKKIPLLKTKQKIIVHLCCIGIPLILLLLQQITNPVGIMPNSIGKNFCTYSGPVRDGFIWHSVIFFGYLFFCIVVISVLMIEIFIWKRQQDVLDQRKLTSQSTSSQTYIVIRDVLSLYIFTMIACWLPYAFEYFLDGGQMGMPDNPWYGVFCVLRSSSGIFTSIIFFLKSPEIRRKWLKLLARYFRVDFLGVSASSEGHNSTEPDDEFGIELTDNNDEDRYDFCFCLSLCFLN